LIETIDFVAKPWRSRLGIIAFSCRAAGAVEAGILQRMNPQGASYGNEWDEISCGDRSSYKLQHPRLFTETIYRMGVAEDFTSITLV